MDFCSRVQNCKLLIMIVQTNVTRELDVSKRVVTAMIFTIDDKHLIKWMRVKKLRRKTLAHDVFDRS